MLVLKKSALVDGCGCGGKGIR